MSESKCSFVRWRVEDPQGRQVILKQSTYENHIIGDHELQDARIRIEAEPSAKQTVISPALIIEDDTQRRLYYNVVIICDAEQRRKIKTLKVVVETDRSPNEVITWVILRKGESVGENEAIVYERGKDGLSNKEI